jgi:hypothetical protein
MDTKLKKTLETLKLIEQASREYEPAEPDDADEEAPLDDPFQQDEQ